MFHFVIEKILVPKIRVSLSTGHGKGQRSFADVIKLRSGSGEITLDELWGWGVRGGGINVFMGVFKGWQEGLGYKML